MSIYLIITQNETDLYLLKDGRYQLINEGQLSSLMVGYKYILVENFIASYFQRLEIEGVTFQPATIWDRRSNIEYSDYQTMFVKQHFLLSDIYDIDTDGVQFFLMDDQYLFVSSGLKLILNNSNFGFKFSEGLSNFA